MSWEGKPYDGVTIGRHLTQVRSFLGQGRGREVFVDRGYRGNKPCGAKTFYVERERRGPIPKSL